MSMNTLMTIEERIKLHEGNLEFYQNHAKVDKTAEGQELTQKNIKEEQDKLKELYQRRELLKKPSFQMVIAPRSSEVVTNVLAMSSRSQSEAMYETNDELILAVKDGRFKPYNGEFHIIVVRTALFSLERSLSITEIINGNAFISDMVVKVENGVISIL